MTETPQPIELANVSAETKLLATLMHIQMAPATAMSLGLTRDDFAWEIHSIIYDAVMRIVERGGVVDADVVIGEIDANGDLKRVGGDSAVRVIADEQYNPNVLSEYVGMVRDRSVRRRLMGGFEACSYLVHSEPDIKELIHGVQNRMYRVFDSYMSQAFNGITPDQLEGLWDNRNDAGIKVPYTWNSVEAVLNGRSRGSLNIWGLYSSDGKSTVALRNMVFACRAGFKVGYFLLEMTEIEITARLLSYMTGIDNGRIERNEISIEEHLSLMQSFEEIERWDFKLYCDPSINPDDIRAIQMREDFDLIEIDYLQRFDFKDFNEIPRMAKKLKNLALTTKCVIDLYSQLTPKSVNPGQNPFTKPDLMSLYGGKATAHEADNVLFIWAQRAKDDDGGWDQRTGYGTFIASKVRQGRVGAEFQMKFDSVTIQWEES